jgi:hypothetical protein
MHIELGLRIASSIVKKPNESNKTIVRGGLWKWIQILGACGEEIAGSPLAPRKYQMDINDKCFKII